MGRKVLSVILAGAVLTAALAGCAPATTSAGAVYITPEPSAAPSRSPEPSPEPSPTPEPTPGPITLEAVRQMGFGDVAEDAPYRDAVAYMAYRKYLQGVGGQSFAPQEAVDRAMAVTVLFRVFSPSLGRFSPYSGTFSDVSQGDWFAEPVAWAAEKGILAGFPDGTFRPHEKVDRAQLATLFYHCAQATGAPTQPGDLSGFWDVDQVPDYAREALGWAVSGQIYTPLTAGAVNATYPVTRGQLAQVMTALVAHCTGEPVAAEIAQAQAAAVQSKSRQNHAQLQQVVDAAAQKYGAVGVQVAVIEGGRVTDAYQYGWADTANGVPMSVNHKIRIASITKPVIAMTAMRLSEEGLFDLDASVGQYWGVSAKNSHYPDTPVSSRTILCHTSSVPVYSLSDPRDYATVRARLASSAAYRNVKPGSLKAWGYNNYAFGILGMSMELAMDQVMDDISGARFFAPLAIDGAYETGEIQNTDLLAVLYTENDKVYRSLKAQKEDCRPGGPGADGGHFSGGLTVSAVDLAKLVAVLAGDGVYEGQRLLSAESVAFMESPIGTPAGQVFEQCHPLRMIRNAYGRGALYTHGGSNYGSHNYILYDSDTGDGVVVLTTGAHVTPETKDSHGIYAICAEIAGPIFLAVA